MDGRMDGWMDGWIAILRPLKQSVISGRWFGDNEWLYAMEPCLRLKRSPPQAGLKSETDRSAGQRLTHRATGSPYRAFSHVVLFKYMLGCVCQCCYVDGNHLGPAIQSIVSLTSSFTGQLVKCFTTLLLNTLIFLVEKIKAAFAIAKASHIFSTKNIGKFQILTFEILTYR